MVAFNSESTIQRALISIRNQSVKVDELIVVDGGSTDSTLAIIDGFHDIVSLVISEPDSGIYNAMNKGLRLIKSDIVGYLNSDDEFAHINCLKSIKENFKLNCSAKIFISGVDYLKSNGVVSRQWRLKGLGSFKSGWHPAHPGFYASRELLIKIRGFNEDYRIASDFDLMLRCFLLVEKEDIIIDNGKIVNMYLGGASNASFKNIFKGNSEIRKSLASNGINVSILYTPKRLTKKLISKWKKKQNIF